jgi:hypothetical protein
VLCEMSCYGCTCLVYNSAVRFDGSYGRFVTRMDAGDVQILSSKFRLLVGVIGITWMID